MEYKVLNKSIFTLEGYSLVPLREEDLLLVMEWRNDQIDVLRQSKLLSKEDQRRYYQNYISPSYSQQKPNIILFSFLFDNECIGYGGLTNVSWSSKRAEVSFLLNTSHVDDVKKYTRDFSVFLQLLKEVTFQTLDFNRLFTETFDIRPDHIAVLEKNGFVMEGRMKEHAYINGKYVDSLIHGFLKKYYS